MEVICSSETTVNLHQTTWHYIPEHRTLQKDKSLWHYEGKQILHDLEKQVNGLRKGHSSIWGEGDLMVQMCKAKRPARVIIMTHKARMMNTGRKNRKTKLETKKPHCSVQYNNMVNKSIHQSKPHL
jgi:phosphoribosyl 1,2-cyclic phosphodiesterase